jgi:SpoVK/Ycf46/Vps4 family AAA+-type ATPase
MVQHLVSDAGWSDLTLPPAQHEALLAIALRAQRAAPASEPRALSVNAPAPNGNTALFAGSDSAARTTAAAALANELGVDLYRVDLSQVVSKYIGETEKNLDRLFDATEKAGVVLFFDEADALFGKRTDVKDSHDRYANIEINYLLERLEAFEGVAILATNRKASLDDAFLRRIRYVVDFPDE